MSATAEEKKVLYEDISLNSSEYLQAMIVGCMRCAQDRRKGARHRYGAEPARAEEYSIRGAVAEALISKKMGVFWLGVGVLGGIDVGGRYEVRSSSHDKPFLCLHQEDRDDIPYILIRVIEGNGRIFGWTYGRDGKQEQYWGDKWNKNRPAYWIPVSDLRPMSELPE